MNQLVAAALALAAGGCIALQASANGKFRQNLGIGTQAGSSDSAGPAWAAFFSICGTFLCAVTAMLLLRPAMPSKATIATTQWWNWIGGPLGALIVLAGATLLPYLKAAPFICLVVAGQLTCSVLLDHFGLMGLPVTPISPWKVFGVMLVLAGVVCIKFL